MVKFKKFSLIKLFLTVPLCPNSIPKSKVLSLVTLLFWKGKEAPNESPYWLIFVPCTFR